MSRMLNATWTLAMVLGALLLSSCAQTKSDRAEVKVRVVLAGDSTVASDGGWGDAFGDLLKPGVECINLGRNGRSSKSYRDEGWWQQVLDLHPTFVLIQFGHNDEPGKGPQRETDPRTTYSENLARYVDEARAIGAMPVLVTSLTRRNFDSDGRIKDTLGPYVEAVKRVGAEKRAPVVELNARSVELMERIGPQAASEFDKPGGDLARPDHTHLSPKGKIETAGLVAAEVRRVAPELAEFLKPENSTAERNGKAK